MVVVQLAMGQFSPRIVQNFPAGPPHQLARRLCSWARRPSMSRKWGHGFEGEGEGVAGAVTGSYLFVLFREDAMLLGCHCHIGPSVQGVRTDRARGEDMRRQLDRWYPDSIADNVQDSIDISAEESGVLIEIVREALGGPGEHRRYSVPAVALWVRSYQPGPPWSLWKAGGSAPRHRGCAPSPDLRTGAHFGRGRLVTGFRNAGLHG